MKKAVFKTILAGLFAFFLSSGLSAKSHKGHHSKSKSKAQVCKCCGMKMEKGKKMNAVKSAKLPQCGKKGKGHCGSSAAKKRKKKHH